MSPRRAAPHCIPGGPIAAAVALCLMGCLPTQRASAQAPVEWQQGDARSSDGARLLYRETHFLFERDGQRQRVVLYTCPNGAAFARKRVLGADSIAPDFDFLDGRDGYREGVRGAGTTRTVFTQQRRDQAPRESVVLIDGDAVIDAGFDAFIQQRWSSLAGAQAATASFLVPSRFATLGVKFLEVDADASAPMRHIRMRLAAWYGAFLPPVTLGYDVATHQLREFDGVGSIRDASGHNVPVRIVFPEAPHAVDETALDAALASDLSGQCTI